MGSEADTPLSQGAIRAVLQFAPIFADPSFVAGEAQGGDRRPDGVIDMPWVAYNPEVVAFEKALCDHGWVVSFDWPSWQDEAERLLEPSGIETADLEMLRRLLTVIVRKERFCEGTLEWAFDQGIVDRILGRIAELDTRDATRRAYLATIVTVEVPGIGWSDATTAARELGEPILVLTAWNPGPVRPTPEANALANDLLREALAELGLPLYEALGTSPDGSHQEASIAVVGLRRDTARELGHRFGQDAIFELTATTQSVVGCDGDWSLARPLP